MSDSGLRALRSCDVSRETLERLNTYQGQLLRWNEKINLVGKTTISDVWERHFEDSAQIFPLVARNKGVWLDLGSGAGFPGLVLAIIASEQAPDLNFHLVEADQRKVEFLRAVVRMCDLKTRLICARIEDVPPVGANIITARALASLEDLLRFVEKHGTCDTISVFPKGQRNDIEILRAKESFRFDVQQIPSTTDPRGSLLIVRNLRRD